MEIPKALTPNDANETTDFTDDHGYEVVSNPLYASKLSHSVKTLLHQYFTVSQSVLIREIRG